MADAASAVALYNWASGFTPLAAMRSFYDVIREELERLLAPLDSNPRKLARRLFAEVYRS